MLRTPPFRLVAWTIVLLLGCVGSEQALVAASAGELGFPVTGLTCPEGNSGANLVRLTVTRTGGSAGAVSVNYLTQNNTAIAGSDYVAASGTLN